MRFLIYGAGAIGSVFGGKLALAGYDVTVLAKGNRFKHIEKDGIILQRAYSTQSEVIRTKVIDTLSEDDIYDYILVAMQKTQVESILPVLSKNKSFNIVFLVNNALGYDAWAEAVGENRLMMGFPSAGGERREGRVCYFIGRGILRGFQTTTFGEYNGKKTERLKALIKAFDKSGIPAVSSENMDAWQKTHVSIVTSIANALYKHGSDNYSLGRAYRDLHLMVLGIKEGLGVIRKLGYSITPAKLNYFKLPACIIALVFKLVMGTRLAEITMAKHTIAARDEMIHLQNEFDTLIKKAGVKTPAIDELREYLYQ